MTARARRPVRNGRAGRVILAVLCLALLAMGGAGAYLYDALAASTARMGGTGAVAGLAAAVRVEIDSNGTPRIVAQSELDAVRAQGFCDAQERFFQMDVARRYASGELSALVGGGALASDRRMRVMRFRAVARAFLAQCPQRHLALLAAYAQGVNAGLTDLGARPPEHMALGADPRPWTPEDSMVVMYGVHTLLALDAPLELQQSVMVAALPEELVRFLTPDTTRWDAPLLDESGRAREPADGPTAAVAVGYTPRAVPGPEVVDIRGRTTDAPAGGAIGAGGAVGLGTRGSMEPPAPEALGSNNWAVDGSRTDDGRAILASDPHLPLLAPAFWRRVRLEWPGVRVAGAAIPGLPGVVIGATADFAWGFTNVCGDFEDFVLVETDPDDAGVYRTPDLGASRWERFGEIVEVIEVRGGEPEELRLRSTRWGVVTHEDHAGRPLVLKSAALDPALHNLNVFDMPRARTLEEAVEVLKGARIPPQNALVAHRDGRIAWVVTGFLPRRAGFDGSVPVSWADPNVGWKGESERRPSIVDPPGGALFSANNRTVGDAAWSRTLGRVWANPVRAGRIGAMLGSRATLDEDALRAMQADTVAPLMEAYRSLALGAVPEDHANAAVRRARGLVESWNGRADADQPGYRVAREFRRAVVRGAIDPLVAPCVEKQKDFRFSWWLVDETVFRLLEERPRHLLSAEFESWDALLTHAFESAVGAIEERERTRGAPGLAASWGEVNKARAQHALARAVPALGRVLNMPDLRLDGDTTVVRVASPEFGASMRFVASPSRPDAATLTLAGGQSGHFLSAHYREEFRAWARGEGVPLFRTGPVRTFTLEPAPAAQAAAP